MTMRSTSKADVQGQRVVFGDKTSMTAKIERVHVHVTLFPELNYAVWTFQLDLSLGGVPKATLEFPLAHDATVFRAALCRSGDYYPSIPMPTKAAMSVARKEELRGRAATTARSSDTMFTIEVPLRGAEHCIHLDVYAPFVNNKIVFPTSFDDVVLTATYDMCHSSSCPFETNLPFENASSERVCIETLYLTLIRSCSMYACLSRATPHHSLLNVCVSHDALRAHCGGAGTKRPIEDATCTHIGVIVDCSELSKRARASVLNVVQALKDACFDVMLFDLARGVQMPCVTDKDLFGPCELHKIGDVHDAACERYVLVGCYANDPFFNFRPFQGMRSSCPVDVVVPASSGGVRANVSALKRICALTNGMLFERREERGQDEGQERGQEKGQPRAC